MWTGVVTGAFVAHAFWWMCLHFRGQWTHTVYCLLIGTLFLLAFVYWMHALEASLRVMLPVVLFVGLGTERVFCTAQDHMEPDTLTSKKFLVLTIFTSSICAYASWQLIMLLTEVL